MRGPTFISSLWQGITTDIAPRSDSWAEQGDPPQLLLARRLLCVQQDRTGHRAHDWRILKQDGKIAEKPDQRTAQGGKDEIIIGRINADKTDV